MEFALGPPRALAMVPAVPVVRRQIVRATVPHAQQLPHARSASTGRTTELRPQLLSVFRHNVKLADPVLQRAHASTVPPAAPVAQVRNALALVARARQLAHAQR